jgi:3,4-dihydroxy 2-butanone 4-phosphate synthase/GTP cyclohydrolase II
MTTPFDSIDSAIEAIRDGQAVIVVDTNPNRSCGALVASARHMTPQLLRYFLRKGRGFLSVPLDQSLCLKYGLRPLEGTRADGLTYTMSYNLAASPTQAIPDRARAISAIVDPTTLASSLSTPGFLHPVLTTADGTLEFPTFANATTDLCRLAGEPAAGATIHILRDDGELARIEDLFTMSANDGLRIVSLESLISFRLQDQQVLSP